MKRAALLMTLAPLILAACGSTDPLDVPKPCPQVRVDLNTADLRGMATDGSEVAWLAQIVGYDGSCDYEDDGVEVVMDVDFQITRGPGFESGQTVDFHYFVAIPQYFPLAVGKQMFPVSLEPSGAGDVLTHQERNVRVFIPLERRQSGGAFDIYVGFQVPAGQLQENTALGERS